MEISDQYTPKRPFLINVTGLCKQFGTVTALNGISFEVQKGELFGFLGPNGAGKTTTINILTGLARADSGQIHISDLDCSKNPKAAQHLIGIVPDESNLYPELTGFQNLDFCAALYGFKKQQRQKRAFELLNTFGLKDAADRKFGGYSRGMKRKLTIAAGIIHQPQILFLDEPTTGIDVASARQIRKLIADLHQNGTTIFLTTHYIEEAERLCEKIAFIDKGQIVRVDTVENLLQPLQEKKALLIKTVNTPRKLTRRLADKFLDYDFREISTGEVKIESTETINIGPLVRMIEELGAELIEARRVQQSLEDVFMQVTGIKLEEMKKEKRAINP